MEYLKQYYTKRQTATLDHEAWYTSDVAFNKKAEKSTDERTLGELVTGLFHFYGTVFDPRKHAISVCKAENLLDKKTFQDQLIAMHDGDEFVLSKFCDEIM